jgi:hypothetical protein
MTVRSLRYRMAQCGIRVRNRYSLISTADLESLVRQICTENSALGEVSVRSRLGHYGFNVQRGRVRAAIDATVGHIVQPRRIMRRVYYVRAPLSVIHLDGNHKLVR